MRILAALRLLAAAQGGSYATVNVSDAVSAGTTHSCGVRPSGLATPRNLLHFVQIEGQRLYQAVGNGHLQLNKVNAMIVLDTF